VDAAAPVAQVGGFSVQWRQASGRDGLVLLAQMAGNGVDRALSTLNPVVGTREDSAAGRWGSSGTSSRPRGGVRPWNR
jgi:hypothetical protein